MLYGPTLAVSEETHAARYRAKGETYYDMACRLAGALCDGEDHRRELKRIILGQKFLFAGRIQRGIGSPDDVTAMNCYVSGTIPDSCIGIMERAKDAMLTMRMGGGIGYDFSTIRPRGALIKTLGSGASGPVSFMSIFDAVCATVASAGNRRGAQMGVLRVDHPDIEEYVSAKQSQYALTGFNMSVGVTDDFMFSVRNGGQFQLQFEGQPYRMIDARMLWDKIMRSTWDWAEPGVLFLDRINDENNLKYCETIAATNPCGEQPLPPYGACLLGSWNLVKYIVWQNGHWVFDIESFKADIPPIVRAMDNVIDRTSYPLPEHKKEQQTKRRMGIGVTGVANALEICGHPYASLAFIGDLTAILETLRNESYRASVALAREKKPFPLFEAEYLKSPFICRLPEDIQEDIAHSGIRNSHLLSIAPTGTISLTADNISSGIEPVFAHQYDRTILEETGPRVERVTDYAFREYGVKGKMADELEAEDHVRVLVASQPYIDSAISKTCNVGDDVSWERFKELYMMAWLGNAKGCTTFRKSGKKMGILKADDAPKACTIDPVTGKKTCD